MNKRNVVLLVVFLFSILGCQRGKPVKRFTTVVEGKVVDVPALVGGKITRVLVETGQVVHKGEMLAVVDTTDLRLQREQLQATLAEVEARQQILETQFQRARADLAYARQRLQRTEALFQDNTVPQQTLDDARNQYQRVQSAFQAARQQLTTVNATRTKVLVQLKQVNKKINDARITAPVAGIISTKYVETGEAAPPMAPVVEITNLDTVWVKIFVSEPMLSSIHTGQIATIYVDGTDKTLQGTVVWMSPQAEFTPKNILTPETRTSLVYAVKINIPNPQGILKIGMPVEVAL